MESSSEEVLDSLPQPVGGFPGEHVLVPTAAGQLWGWLNVPAEASGAVLVPCFSPELPRETLWAFAAEVLSEWGLATLLFDPLAAHETALELAVGGYRANDALIAPRLAHALDWMVGRPSLVHLRAGMLCAEANEEAAFSAMDMAECALDSVLVFGSPHRQRPHRAADGIACGYLVAPPTSDDAPAQVAGFAAAWFSQTLRPRTPH